MTLLLEAADRAMTALNSAPRTIQELPGHRSVRTTMVYTHALNRPGLGVQSPLDRLGS